MFASLRLRLTIAYFVVAGLLLGVVAIVGTVFVLSMYARATDDNINSVRAQAPALVKLLDTGQRPLADVGPQIIERLERTSVRVTVYGDNGARVERDDGAIQLTPPPADGKFRPPTFGRRNDFWRGILFGLGGLFGMHPTSVRVPGGVINIFPDLDRFRGIFVSSVVTLSAAGFCMALVALFLGRYITNQALKPLVDVTESLRRFSLGDFSPGAVVTSQRNEMGELATAFNAAADQVVTAFAERERNARHMRQFIADAGHELRTPLTVVMGYIDVLRRGAVTDRELAENILGTMGSESRRMRTLIDKLIFLARLDRDEAQQALETVDVAEITGKIVEKFAPLAGSGLNFERNGSAWIVGDPAEINEAISNIVDNALKYASNAPIDVRVVSENGTVAVAIKDRGPGMTQEEQTHAFDRFYRGEKRFDVEGSGLGLAIAKSAVERAHGTLRLTSAAGAGTEFRIELPRAD
jgi:signal transduction histidine kinase